VGNDMPNMVLDHEYSVARSKKFPKGKLCCRFWATQEEQEALRMHVRR